MMRLIFRRSMPEVAGDGALAAARAVPGPDRLLYRWCTSWHAWCIMHHTRRSRVRMTGGNDSRLRIRPGSDKGH
jgi:hypothetical protein